MDANPAPAKAPRIEMFKVKRIHEDAVLPKRGSDKAARYDLSRCGPTPRCFPAITAAPRGLRARPCGPLPRARRPQRPPARDPTPRPCDHCRPPRAAAARTPWCPRAARCA
jgi:hypothetical protein